MRKRSSVDGAGLLYEKFEKLKQELEEMGMFEQEYKRPIPPVCQHGWDCNSAYGGGNPGYHSILPSRRNPYVQLYLCPALVQGEDAAESIADGIRRLDAFGVDVIIVGSRRRFDRGSLGI